MKVEFHLTTTKKGVVRVTKGMPNLNFDEVAVRMEMEIPDVLFERPQLEAKIVVPEIRREPFKAEVLDNIENAIKTQAGYPVTVRLVDEKKDD